jgi:hypothetical protein
MRYQVGACVVGEKTGSPSATTGLQNNQVTAEESTKNDVSGRARSARSTAELDADGWEGGGTVDTAHHLSASAGAAPARSEEGIGRSTPDRDPLCGLITPSAPTHGIPRSE